MNLVIALFAGLADRIGSSQIEYTYADTSVTADQLKAALADSYPGAASLINSSFLAVNQEYARGDMLITEKDELALIPPVSGGESGLDEELYIITADPISVEEVTRKVITANHGASITFTGTTREMTEGQRTIHLEYEAYIPMALSKLRQIGREVDEKWPGTRCAISHRIGKVDIAGISVVIAVSSPHRAACYEASRYSIERLKQMVPIWKKEVWEDGTEWKGHGSGPWDPSAPAFL